MSTIRIIIGDARPIIRPAVTVGLDVLNALAKGQKALVMRATDSLDVENALVANLRRTGELGKDEKPTIVRSALKPQAAASRVRTDAKREKREKGMQYLPLSDSDGRIATLYSAIS
jgi:hypothetical protein